VHREARTATTRVQVSGHEPKSSSFNNCASNTPAPNLGYNDFVQLPFTLQLQWSLTPASTHPVPWLSDVWLDQQNLGYNDFVNGEEQSLKKEYFGSATRTNVVWLVLQELLLVSPNLGSYSIPVVAVQHQSSF
jgi:hypothetical protein